ncbi:MAG: DNA-binding protein [Nitrospirae bacterium GWC2_57_13]|jgi:uncharacterized protein|nr:MAG: DNA-binding protein [Nitrospirae bacterium GWC1_57_7]OGW28599.1 MAG: DNA-binding protein [Nitrospirae bacterium GWC2_57_13]OGW42920.1 MAG: DNA-binding protein [Nitrospirae bacterium GWD2_57_8]HAS54185.1 DNA-binding protein [Nitrospiraceae bacterium]
MTAETRTLIAYRLQRAREALDEAALLLERNHINTFVNRVYYACFYGVTALLLIRDLASAKHSGVRSLFHQHFVKTGIVSIDIGQTFDKLFDNRQKGDYADLVRFEKEQVRGWLEEARKFVETIEKVIRELSG